MNTNQLNERIKNIFRITSSIYLDDQISNISSKKIGDGFYQYIRYRESRDDELCIRYKKHNLMWRYRKERFLDGKYNNGIKDDEWNIFYRGILITLNELMKEGQ